MFAGRSFVGINLLYQNKQSGVPTATDLNGWKMETGVDEPVVAAKNRDWIDPIWGTGGSGAAAGMLLLSPGMIIEKITLTWDQHITVDEVEPHIPD